MARMFIPTRYHTPQIAFTSARGLPLPCVSQLDGYEGSKLRPARRSELVQEWLYQRPYMTDVQSAKADVIASTTTRTLAVRAKSWCNSSHAS
ncbi:hypothetical protein G6F32_015361 [Rhizopus arrhizus]|nr:hypothetical protein G6F32_015361 [Rhizopus arrhizus]